MIEEWLGLGMVVGHTEYLDEELLEQLEVRVPAKGFVKGEDGRRADSSRSSSAQPWCEHSPPGNSTVRITIVIEAVLRIQFQVPFESGSRGVKKIYGMVPV